ncbi:MAG: hypothetical protein OEZ02_10855 [Anaerolineae bacterium]|nr:hypothetical protein [Anaerolineae bacterium]
MRRILIPLIVVSLACSSITGINRSSDKPEGGKSGIVANDNFSLADPGLSLAELGAFEATFKVTFMGAYDWSYTLVTRSDGQAMEYQLHIAGVSGEQNPGDVRLVSDNGINRMRGPGTDDVCVQFPDSFDSGVLFLTPANFVFLEGLTEAPASAGTENIAGLETNAFEVEQKALDAWENIKISYWEDAASGATLRYDFSAEGPDPVYDAGNGSIVGHFEVNAIGAQTIKPIEDCELGLPVPDNVRQLLKLPGLISFEVSITPEQVRDYYHSALLDAGWQRATLPQTSPTGDVVVTYLNATEKLQLNIEKLDTGSKVEIYTTER